MLQQQIIIPAKEGKAFKIQKGQTIRITDIEGEQVADLVAYRINDATERLDTGVTMDAIRTIALHAGHILYSNQYRPMFTVITDLVGRHDFTSSACRPEMYEFLYNKSNHANCHHNLAEALAPFGLAKPDQYYTFNIFMNTVIDANGQISVKRPLSRAGDYIELRAEMDVIAAISACPCEESECNGYQPTSVGVTIF